MFRRSDRSTPPPAAAVDHSNPCSSWAIQRWVVARASILPGQTRRPAPKGARRRSLPSTLTSSSWKRSGRNASGSGQMAGSCAMAHMFTIAVVPAGTRCPPTCASWTARRAHESSGPGGCMRSVSFTMHWMLATSASDTARPRPTTASSSACALAWMSGCSTIRAMIHSIRIATVSVKKDVDEITHETIGDPSICTPRPVLLNDLADEHLDLLD
ncbi:LOW QUALITY PROTEIN: hypothetical protein U9M48_015833 [Paspalum notatum var. saurae]|uniref:Uncharacterized protein n=1 Tax=Paspalum notatum var. saurae TaxID=547442 RepID=A0AAQ3WM78_PASNO